MDNGIGGEGRCHVGLPVAVHEHVDVLAEARAGLTEAIAHARPPGIKLINQRQQGGGVAVKPTRRRIVEEDDQRTRQVNGGQGDQASRVAASTDQMGGRKSAASCQLSPSSLLAKTCPVLVPKYTPAGSIESVAIASRSTPR